MLTPQAAVKGMLKDVGKESMTRGALIHDLPMGLIFRYTPTRILDAIEYSGAV